MKLKILVLFEILVIVGFFTAGYMLGKSESCGDISGYIEP